MLWSDRKSWSVIFYLTSAFMVYVNIQGIFFDPDFVINRDNVFYMILTSILGILFLWLGHKTWPSS